ncbi:MAG: GNAT family N-acetyltransferase [Fimbriimonas ginsengisoli]|uniref:GNAT family N-acetyltransferase n=1 Tax=Fimbriimonas ginsengisoli TaxID=1005039 RepID=A0A931PW45_FIMGI|nr:GNAT family N-acetyltransferase [Fimbriimonas ginsengisoli]
MAIRRFQSADLPEVEGLWNRFYPARFRLDLEMLRLHTVDSPAFDFDASFAVADGASFVACSLIKSSATPTLYPGGEARHAHLCAFACASPDSGDEALRASIDAVRRRGATRLVLGQDSRHLLPGCPDDALGLRASLERVGFRRGGEIFDLERDLQDYRPRPLPEGSAFRPLDEADMKTLDRLLKDEFSPRWRFDVTDKARREGPECVFGLFVDGSLSGFALLQQEGAKLPLGGAVWRASLGPNWCSLGPIGVVKALRGRGLGDALLGSALERLRDRGARRCIIDWTVLASFYEAHGFAVTRRYTAMSLDLAT